MANKTKFTIGIEGQRLFRTKKHGMDMVALELIRELQKYDKVNQYYIFVQPFEDVCLEETENFKIIPLKLKAGDYATWEQIALPKAAKKYKCDLLHCTSNTGPIYSDVPLMLTLHDIIFLEKTYLKLLVGPFTRYQKFGNIYRKYVVPRIINHSEKVITVSKYEKRRIDTHFGITEDKIVSVYNGVSSHFRNDITESSLQRVKEKYKLPDQFLFFLGNTDPKKNTEGTLEAIKQLFLVDKIPHKLVMLDYDEAELMRLLTSLGAPELRERIHLTGYVVNTDLPEIYKLSDIFLYPSLRESFGIPMLEAMKCGVPVITSNTSSMPEVSGGAAHIVDPFKPQEIVDGVLKILNDESYAKELVDLGLKRAEKFSWYNMMLDVHKLYMDFLNSLT